MSTSGIRRILDAAARAVPEIRKPGRKLPLNERLIWTALVLVVYEAMSNIVLYGLESSLQGQQSPLLLNVIFASNIGTLTTLGIGPIVTAGLILQLMVGAEIIKLDLRKPEDRGLFTAASKFLSIVIAIFQAGAYVMAGFFGPLTFNQQALVFAQLVAATIIIIMLDEMVQKGWGIGSGISLFIAAGVAGQIFTDLFSPIILPDGFYHGVVLASIQAAMSPEGIGAILVRPVAQRGDLLGLIATLGLILLIIYLEGIKVNIPISHSRFAGYRGKYPVKLLYVSNVPVIFASTIFTNIYYLASIFWSRFNPDNSNPIFNLIGTFEIPSGGGQPTARGGLAYFVLGPNSFTQAVSDPVRAIVFAGLMVVFSILFAKFWVSIGGLSPMKVAQQLISAGMQVPGFRRAPSVIAGLLSRYISTVTIIGAVIVGLLASLAGYVNVFGTGTGLLLMVGIIYQLYEQLVRERITEEFPAVAKLLGEA